MTVKIRFDLYRATMSTGERQTVAICSLSDRIFTMKDLQRVLDDYAIGCDSAFRRDNDRPMVDNYVLEFEDHMYSAFIIGET